MNVKRLLIIVIAAMMVSVLAVVPVVSATVTVYPDDWPGWESAVGDYEEEFFTDATLNPRVSVVSDRGYVDTAKGVWWDKLICPGETGGPTTTTWTFDTAITAFGGNWDPGTPGGSGAGIAVSIDGSWVSVGEIPRTYTGNFWGFVSTEPFTQVRLESGSSSGWCETYELDNMVYSSNRPPVADANGPYEVDEGTAVNFNASGSSDPDGDTLEYRWDFENNGTWTDWSISPYASHTWCDDHDGTAKVEVRDTGGLTDDATALVTVNNVAPTVNAAIAQNLLTNPGAETGDLSGWTIIANGGNGWNVRGSGYEGSHSFATSYNWCKRSQEIDLLAMGYTEAQLDAAPDVIAEEWFAGYGAVWQKPNAHKDYCYLKAELRDVNHNVIDSYNSGVFQTKTGTGWYGPWEQRSHIFSGYGVGLRYIYFEDGGDDQEFWAGRYGPALDAASVTMIYEGDTVSFTGSFTDPGCDSWTYEWDFGDGSPPETGTCTPDVPVTATHEYCDNGVYTVTLTVTDDDNGVGTATLTVTVNNVAPTVDAGPDQTVNENDTVIVTWSFTDPGCDSWEYELDWDDGTPVAILPCTPGTYTAMHVYCQDGVYTVTVTVTDDDAGVGSDTLTVTVLNVLPVVDAGLDQVVTQGDTVYFSGSFTDPGCDTWTYEWDFGDYVNPVVETGNCAPDTPITATHVYTYPDIYTATLTVYDDDGYGIDTVEITVRPKYVDIDSEGVRIVYMLSRFGEVYSTRRANDNWLPYGTGPQQPPAGAEYVGVSSDGINYVYILNEEGKVYYTRRSTDNWMQYGTGRTQPPADTYVDLTSDGIRKVYILKEDGTVYYTTSANGNWMQYGTGTAPPAGDYVGIASDGINYVYILRDDGTVYYTTRYNGNWVQYGTGTVPPAGDYSDIVVDGIKQAYILNDDSTVYYTTRANGNWMQYGTGSPQPPVGPSVFGYQAISSEGIRQVYTLNEDRAVHYTRRANDAWYRYGTGAQQPQI